MSLPGQTFSPILCQQCKAVWVKRTSTTHRYCRPCGIERTALLRDIQQGRNQRRREINRKMDPSYKNREHFRDGLRKNYKMSIASYEKMLARQQGVCLICREVCKTGRRLAVDHDKVTGRVRGLLCGACNMALGGMSHNPARLERAASYLRGRL